jgi:predicted AAA+ superfamily ATPase
MHYYRTQNGAEVDIILSKALKPIACIEIKLSNSPVISRGFYNAIKDLNTMDNFVITPNSETYPHKNSLVCSLAYFLKNHLARIEAL